MSKSVRLKTKGVFHAPVVQSGPLLLEHDQSLSWSSWPECAPALAVQNRQTSASTLTGALSLADVAVVPLISGGGTRMKILDYFAAGVPVVSTAKGCEGLPLTGGQELLIRDDWDSFADSVTDLLEHTRKRTALAERATAFVEQLDWLEIGRRHDQRFRRLGQV